MTHALPRLRLVIACCIAFLTGCSTEPGLPGGFDGTGTQRIYVIELDGDTAGRIEERRGRTSAGAPRMDTLIEVVLPGTGLMLREERLQFAADPPHVLLQRTRFTRTPTGIEHHEVSRGDELGSPTLADLDDTLELANAPVGTQVRQRGLFGSGEGESMVTAWEVESRDAAGTHARGRRDDGAEVALWLAPDGTPERYRIGTGFTLRRVDEAPVLPVEQSSPLLMEVAARLGDAARIDRLNVRVTGPAAELFRPGPGLELHSRDEGIELHGRRLDAATELSADDRRLLEAMVTEVRRQVRYHPGAAPPSLNALLTDGRGDCYEFAALFSALAQRAGFDARLVTGLAWAGDELGGFAPHAWNEVRIGNTWLSVDPTWDQVGADAARLRFPDDPGGQLDLQLALKRSSIEIIEVAPPG